MYNGSVRYNTFTQYIADRGFGSFGFVANRESPGEGEASARGHQGPEQGDGAMGHSC